MTPSPLQPLRGHPLRAVWVLSIIALHTLLGCDGAEPELQSEPEAPAGYGVDASETLVVACNQMCEQYAQCNVDPYDTCTAECQGGLFLGGVGSSGCVAEYTDFIACLDELPCDASILDPDTVCSGASETAWACNLAHGIECDGGDKTIPESWLCDGVPDCADGMDESAC